MQTLTAVPPENQELGNLLPYCGSLPFRAEIKARAKKETMFYQVRDRQRPPSHDKGSASLMVLS